MKEFSTLEKTASTRPVHRCGISSIKTKSSGKPFFHRVWEVTVKIPKGKVATYGDIARLIGTRDARRIGYALHANRNCAVPCHRVVFADGRLAAGYAFGGEGKQRERLEKEGVEFTKEGKVKLENCRLTEKK